MTMLHSTVCVCVCVCPYQPFALLFEILHSSWSTYKLPPCHRRDDRTLAVWAWAYAHLWTRVRVLSSRPCCRRLSSQHFHSSALSPEPECRSDVHSTREDDSCLLLFAEYRITRPVHLGISRFFMGVFVCQPPWECDRENETNTIFMALLGHIVYMRAITQSVDVLQGAPQLNCDKLFDLL